MMNPNQSEKNRRLRFTSDDDIHFLREVVGLNPFKNIDKWSVIQMNLLVITGKNFLLKTLKQHLLLLLEAFSKKETEIISGVEEYHSEKDALLQEIQMLYKENENKITQKKKKTCKEKQIRMAGEQCREKIAEKFYYNDSENDPLLVSIVGEEVIEPIEIVSTPEVMVDHNYYVETEKTSEQGAREQILQFSRNEGTPRGNQNEIVGTPRSQTPTSITQNLNRSIQGPTRRRNNKAKTLRRDALSYLREKNIETEKIKNKELELQERKILLEEKKYELEVKKMQIKEKKLQIEEVERLERAKLEKEKFHLEMTEKKKMLELLQEQQKAIINLCQRL